MIRKFKYIIVFTSCFIFIFYGFIKISSGLPNIIKEKSAVRVSYNNNPFDLNIDTNNYNIFINDKALNNIKSKTIEVFKSMVEKNPVKKILNK